ncbi:chaperone protein dnaJ 13 [Phalaenopsis equestris]|uniref:chaperone protein dnaJ 13 n=1 Tax=Phalaenopsis equestris TaxID=78828 RepID=UPI0009E1FAB3|nr:chaperone protein dnaJ 13 [Phalaenopsis equestris]
MESSETPERDLYAILNISREASDEDIRKAFRQWAQVYHPDKYQDPELKNVATDNFQRIRDAYEILSDEHKREIYDIYGMEGLNSGYELSEKLNKPEEIKEMLERLKRQKEVEKTLAHSKPSGALLANLSLPQYLDGGSIISGMGMFSEVKSQLSKRNSLAIGGNLSVAGASGTGSASAMLRHQISSVASVEFMASAGLRALLGVQTSRQLSQHSMATLGIAVSLRDGSVNLSNAWTRQLSETTIGNVQLVLGVESGISIGWQKKDDKTSASGELKFGTASLGASVHYTHHFSAKSHGRLAGRIGSTALEFEIGGGRRISKFSTLRLLYIVGIQGISWRFELHRGGQKLIIPVLLFNEFNALFATSAFVLPSSLYFILKKYVLKPYYKRRERQRMLDKMYNKSIKLQEARKVAEKAQKLLEIVSNRKKNKQVEKGGLVISKALYGNLQEMDGRGELREEQNDEVASQVLDVTLPLNFLVSDSGQLKLHGGIRKSGIMGFYDPCPEFPKQLLVEYTFQGENRQVVVEDCDELMIPR